MGADRARKVTSKSSGIKRKADEKLKAKKSPEKRAKIYDDDESDWEDVVEANEGR